MSTHTPPQLPVPAPVAAADGNSKVPTRMGPPGRLDVSVDDETYEAGSGNIVVITIRNPFSVPVRVVGLKEPKSSNLKPQTAFDASSPAQDKDGSSVKSQIKGALGKSSGYSIGFAGVTAEYSSARDARFQIIAKDTSTVDIGTFGSALDNYNRVNIIAQDSSTIKATPPVAGTQSTIGNFIQPHCEINAYLSINTKGWLFYKPTKLILKSELRYLIDQDETEYTQVVSLDFDARPPLRAVVIGSIIGSIFGGIARFVKSISEAPADIMDISTKDFIYLGVRLGGAIIMSTISTIALSRKTGAQGFITVEDFFGGFVVGVLVGYQGTSYFENILSHSDHNKSTLS